MARKKKNKFSTSFLIGVFILTGLVLLVGFILWMGATQFFKEYDYYVTYFEDSVGGLDNGASVKYLGVPCGLVHSITIAPDGRLVQIIIKIDKNLKHNTDSLIVKLESAGLAGGKYIQLEAKGNSAVNNFDFNFELPYPVLPSAPSLIDEFTKSAESIISDLQNFKWKEISDGLAETLDGTSQLVHNKNMELIISDLRETTKALNELIQNLNQTSIASNLEATSFTIFNTANHLETFATNLNTKLDAINISEYMNKYYTDFNQTMRTLDGAVAGVATQFRSSILGINILLEDFDKTNRTLQRTLRNINESPYILLTNPPPAEKLP
ncbi:MAG: MlaD family protein [Firmicutes bacterium]|nr:MlaD family protein [Bacillota bacterium]